MVAMERLANFPKQILMLISLIFIPLLLVAAIAVYPQTLPADAFKGLANAVGKSDKSRSNAALNVPPPLITGPVNTMSKFLDGLLATGFDEESCVSRYESHLYRKRQSPHQPSEYLIAKLRSYESLHRRCGPGTVPYNRTIAKLARTNNTAHNSSYQYRTSESEEECKYVISTTVNGLGNIMLSLVSNFLYAMLTDRVLLVELNQDMSGLFCQPFPNSTWESPTRFSSKHSEIPTFQDLLWRKTNHTSTPVVFVNLLSNMTDQMKHFPCDKSQSLLNKVPVLILLSDQYFIPSLFITPSFQQELDMMFPAEKQSTIFHHLGRYLFHPANQAWGLITRFYQAYLSKADQKIGLQIRVFTPKRTPINVVMDQLLDCTLSNHILPEIDTEREVMHSIANQTTKSIFVASLYQDFSNNLRTMYWSKPTKTGEIVEVFQATHEEAQKFGSNSHQVKALTDMYLLSMSDVLVTSGQSTFGYVAQGLGGLKPWVMPKTIDRKFLDPPCTRGWSMDPCFQVPYAYDCKKKANVEHMSVVFGRTTMKRCKDCTWGSQMVGENDQAR